MKKLLLTLSFIGLLVSCTGPEKKPDIKIPPSGQLSLESLKFQIGLGRSVEELGYSEKAFDSCQTDPTPLVNCGRKTFQLIHFRLQCRDSVGTVDSVSQVELIPVVSNRINWRVGSESGVARTDAEGYGQIQFVSNKSSKKQRMSLKIAGNSLGVTAEDVSRIIVPRDWCE